MLFLSLSPTSWLSDVTSWIPPLCPLVCTCSRTNNLYGGGLFYNTVDCSNSNLHALPTNISSETEAIILGRNRLVLSKIKPLYKLPNLTVVDLSSNHLYTIETWPLNIPSIEFLSLARNDINFLPNRTFAAMINLKSLTVSHNSIEIIHTDGLCGLKKLRELEMSSNRIYEVNWRWFRELSSLEILDLSDNNIHTLRDTDFGNLVKLKTLELSNNHLKYIHDHCFKGLENLQELYLQDNHLKELPRTPMREFAGISVVDVSNNHIQSLLTNTLNNINVSTLRINRMTGLHLIEKHAFNNLPHLLTLELSDNKGLLYIDREAAIGLPKLQTLMVQNNNLSSLEEELVGALPSLKEIHLYGNPFVCDCATYWMWRETAYQVRNITLIDADKVTCVAPSGFKDVSVTSPALRDIPHTCPPRILNLFHTVYNTVLGDQVQIDCRAVGIPRPQIDWLLPSHKSGIINDDVTLLKSGTLADATGRVIVTSTGTLYIDYIQGIDHGQYTCLASNPKGRDERTMRLHVKNMLANVIIIRITENSITVTWKSTQYTHDYQILYKQGHTNHTYKIINIKPYMRSYTASELNPETDYEFCIAVRHNMKSMRINCTLVSTRAQNFMRGVISARDYIIGGFIGCLVTLVILICIITYLVKRYNRRKRQQDELYGDNLSQLFLASMDSMSDTTPITYENRAAEIFDDDDIEEIRCAAANASATTGIK